MNSRLALDHADAVPALEPGVTLLSGGPTEVHRIVVSELAGGRTEALWVDPGMAVSVYALYDLAPSPRTLAGLRVARAFGAGLAPVVESVAGAGSAGGPIGDAVAGPLAELASPGLEG